MGSSTPATSLKVTFFCVLDESLAGLFPNDSTLLPPPLCIRRMKKTQKPTMSRIGAHPYNKRGPQRARGLACGYSNVALDKAVGEPFVLRRNVALEAGTARHDAGDLVTGELDALDLPSVNLPEKLAKGHRGVRRLEHRNVPDQDNDDDEHHPRDVPAQGRVHPAPPQSPTFKPDTSALWRSLNNRLPEYVDDPDDPSIHIPRKPVCAEEIRQAHQGPAWHGCHWHSRAKGHLALQLLWTVSTPGDP